jgi:hypothetical protein
MSGMNLQAPYPTYPTNLMDHDLSIHWEKFIGKDTQLLTSNQINEDNNKYIAISLGYYMVISPALWEYMG